MSTKRDSWTSRWCRQRSQKLRCQLLMLHKYQWKAVIKTYVSFMTPYYSYTLLYTYTQILFYKPHENTCRNTAGGNVGFSILPIEHVKCLILGVKPRTFKLQDGWSPSWALASCPRYNCTFPCIHRYRILSYNTRRLQWGIANKRLRVLEAKKKKKLLLYFHVEVWFSYFDIMISQIQTKNYWTVVHCNSPA